MSTNPFLSTDGEVKIIKSGQRIGQETFVSSIIASYSNMAYNPVALFIFILAITIAFAEDTDNGPLEIFKKKLETINNDKIFIYKLAQILLGVVIFLINNKYMFVKVCFASIPALVKPSSKNIIITIAFIIFVYLFTEWNALEIFVIAQFWYLFTEIRDPKIKIVIMILFCLTCYIAWVLPTTKTDRVYHSTSTTTTRTTTSKP